MVVQHTGTVLREREGTGPVIPSTLVVVLCAAVAVRNNYQVRWKTKDMYGVVQ